MSRWLWAYQSIGFAKQADANTENTTDADFHYFAAECEVPEITRQIFDIAAKTGQVGAHYAPAAGSKRPTVKIKLPIYGFKAAFDPTAQEAGVTDAVISAAQVFLGLLLGSKSSLPASATELRKGFGLARANLTAGFGAVYANNEIAAVPTALTVDVQAGDGGKFYPGNFFACGSSLSDTTQTLAWIKTVAGDTLTWADAPGNQPAINDDVWGTVTAYQSSEQPCPITIRLMGDNVAFKVALVGCVPTKGTITAKAGEPPMLEIEFSAINATTYGTGGGLQALTVKPTLPYPMTGNGAGRLTWAASGSAMAAQCGVRELKLEIASTVVDTPCHNKTSGISERIVSSRDVKVTFQFPRDSGDTITAGNGPWESALDAGTSYQLAVYSGILPGTLFSIFLPSVHQFAPPKIVEVEGVIHDEVSFRPGTYVADSGTGGDAKNSNLRIGCA